MVASFLQRTDYYLGGSEKNWDQKFDPVSLFERFMIMRLTESKFRSRFRRSQILTITEFQFEMSNYPRDRGINLTNNSDQ